MSRAVFIVGNDDDRRSVFCKSLKQQGYNTFVVEKDFDIEQIGTNFRCIVFILLSPVEVGALEIFSISRKRALEEMLDLQTILISQTSHDNEVLRKSGIRADEYLIEPVVINDLFEIIGHFFEEKSGNENSAQLKFGDLILDPAAKTAALRGSLLSLDPSQFRLLRCLMLHPKRVFSRVELAQFAWGDDIFVDERTVDVYIGRIRSVLKHKVSVDPIRTVRNFGYGLNHEFLMLSSNPKKARRR